ncbi:receptor-like kinase [Dorcoceras hygrometricum]|uniref:Receptor-like kinase n=1 Tax=Dorcoceras hygrometricum TaxID=472368 RepID=A0A2Z6ZW72_9LAMI|nr:receptor-like kinase [Dorcoceras hygrometricum]
MGLGGNLTSQLGSLSFLVSLDLSGNSFHGQLLGELAQLHSSDSWIFGPTASPVASLLGWESWFNFSS